MRPIHIVELDKPRPAVVLTREAVLPFVRQVTVAPITSTIRGLGTEVPLGEDAGLDHESVISCDNVQTVPADRIGEHIGFLSPHREPALAEAIATAYDLAH